MGTTSGQDSTKPGGAPVRAKKSRRSICSALVFGVGVFDQLCPIVETPQRDETTPESREQTSEVGQPRRTLRSGASRFHTLSELRPPATAAHCLAARVGRRWTRAPRRPAPATTVRCRARTEVQRDDQQIWGAWLFHSRLVRFPLQIKPFQPHAALVGGEEPDGLGSLFQLDVHRLGGFP